jgi:hypothetical protein
VAGARRLANEVRVGLDNTPQEAPRTVVKKQTSPLDERWMGKPVRQHVREFGAVFGTLFFIVCAVKLYKGVPFEECAGWAAAAAVSAALGYFFPRVLVPLWRAWMKLAHYMGLVMTFVLLSVAWTIGFVPMAYLLKILRIKSMDLRYGANIDSYWEKRDAKYDDFKRLELQY